ncbi:Riboflavin transporter MCH5 [Fulvia fulva]|uniref:Riboflavin transporter MCH5 n=1 Tax=Passalora fulva TaxID=5499 RepID=A0A9Q8PL35_PASFU|nr:Riboflavin transporter MCH5 [Fulvia fulva]KAK4610450.1 Riboflavin transporter MCH5 [Fulvia fulva]KAK4611466.1 Riboflavin transporter MCH5 [Fulvia fulva]UJO24453.1 Riboflavin transporter MCH5 [Fulvia fulva]WPV22029.1 Riboflavin transporter MCH5 [Fulvia fulva]WPV37232.1 Riboflavin transporter MCH5 [Fulvia fulva]
MDVEANPVIHLVASRASAQQDRMDGKNNDVEEAREVSQEDAPDHAEATFPGDRGEAAAWVVLAGSFLALFPSFGLMVSIGTLQDYWQYHQLAGFSSRDIGWISGVFVYLALALGICFGPIFDRYGPRIIMFVGSIAYIAAIFLLAECKLYWHFMLCLGLLAGPAAAALTTIALAVVSHWFKVKRGLASGVAMVGNSFGGVLIPLVLRHCLPRYGYAWSVRTLGFVFTACLIISNLLVRSRFPPSPDAKKAKIFSLDLFGSGSFTFLTLSVFGIEVVLFGSLGILPTYASLSTDYPAATGFYLIAVMNGSSCFGRILPGFISDYVGRFNTLLVMMVFTLIVILVVWLPFGTSSLSALYAFTALFGFGTGSWMAMVPATIATLSGPHHFGRYFGTSYFVASLATLVCIPISGELVQSVGPRALVGFICVMLFVSIGLFATSRWCLLERRWKWLAIV